MILGGFDFSKLSNAVRARLNADAALSQTDVAVQAKVSKATVTRLLKGQVVGVGCVLRLCRWLDRDAWDFMEEQLMLGEAPPAPPSEPAHVHPTTADSRQIGGAS